MKAEKLLMIGCGILKKEVRWLIEKNHWPVDTAFLDSALHIDFDKLLKKLTSALARHRGQKVIVFYGTCHPLMEKTLEKAATFRTHGQNCVEILLGHELFTEELSKGAFFLFEDWARRWEHITTKTFGSNLAVAREIFQEDRRYMLCLRTPCSGDFTAEAEQAGAMMGLPVRWMDLSLDHLESVLQAAITRKMGQTA
ncbi:MAG: DUF1638 domain-containing protein [Desulfobacteraceae bacterium]|jgi:hypothetical protein